MFRRKLLLPGLGLILSCAGIAMAQEAQTPTTTQPNQTVNTDRARRGGLRHRQMQMRRQRLVVGRVLNLTDDQKKQRQAIRQKYVASTRTQREQLFQLREKRLAGSFTPEDKERAKALRLEMRNSMREMRGEALNILSPEQRSQLEGLQQQRKQRREEMMKRRPEFLKNKPAN